MTEPSDPNPEPGLRFLKRQRDELKLRMHLAGKEAREEFERLEAKWKQIEERGEPLTGAVKEAAGTAGDQAKKVTGAAMDVVERELKAGYDRIRRLLD